jgi:5-methylthioribose kinase
MNERADRYRRHDERSLPAELAGVAALRERLGGSPLDWRIEEIGDGNLNLVFRVAGPAGVVAAKQALPYVRMVGESWPLPLSRSHYEHRALVEYAAVCPGATPALIHRDEDLALTIMEWLEPHRILRRGLLDGARYPRFAADIARFLARSLVLTSNLGRPAAAQKAAIAAFAGNTAMCKITEDLVFTEPYFAAPMNRWTSPQLDATVGSLQGDGDLKSAAARLKFAFLTRAEALLHGDLHTGSIMVTPDDTRVIDAEFAVYGPMGFDLGVLAANLLMSAFAQRGHEREPGERAAMVRWILATLEEIERHFEREFLELWRTAAHGDAFQAALFVDAEGQAALTRERRRHLDGLLVDALGFAGLEIIRRTVGLSHVIDFEGIGEPALRAEREARAIALGRRLVVEAADLRTLTAVTGLAAELIGI